VRGQEQVEEASSFLQALHSHEGVRGQEQVEEASSFLQALHSGDAWSEKVTGMCPTLWKQRRV